MPDGKREKYTSNRKRVVANSKPVSKKTPMRGKGPLPRDKK